MAMQHAVGVKLRELVLAELREHGVPAPSSDEQGQGGVIPDSELAALVQRKPAQAHFTVSLGAVERLASRALAAAGRPGARPSITAERAMQFVAPDGDLIQRVEPTAKADTLMVVPVARRLIPVLLEEAVLECRRGRELTSASADEGGGPAAEIWINLPPVGADWTVDGVRATSPSLVAPSQIDGAAPPNWNAMLEVAQQWAAECTRRLARLGIDLAIEAAYIDAARAQAARDLVMRLLDLAILDTKRNEDGSVGADLSKRGLGHALFAHSAAGELVPSSTAFEIADALSTAGSQTRELFWIYSEQRGHHYERIELVCNELTKACDAKFASNFMLPVGKTTPENLVSIAADPRLSSVDQLLWRSRIAVQLLQRRRAARASIGLHKNDADDTGVFIQYTFARISKIEQHFKHITPTQDSPGEVPSNASSLLLALDLGRLPDVLDQALFEPSLVVRFLMDVSTKASSLYYSLRVKDQPYDVASGRMRLWDAVKEVLGHGLWLLGQLPLSEV